jgi:glycerol-3-phosphate dehydrogenase
MRGAGGKWTTYRLMAQDAVDAAVRTGLTPLALPCATAGLRLVGGAGYTSALFTEVAQSYVVPHRPGAIDTRVAKHLACEFPVPRGPCDARTEVSSGRLAAPECSLWMHQCHTLTQDVTPGITLRVR